MVGPVSLSTFIQVLGIELGSSDLRGKDLVSEGLVTHNCSVAKLFGRQPSLTGVSSPSSLGLPRYGNACLKLSPRSRL